MERNNLNLLFYFFKWGHYRFGFDLDNGTLSFYDDDNGLIGTIPFDKTKSACFGAMSNTSITFVWNFGDNPLFSGAET